jgi:hypothetical protein
VTSRGPRPAGAEASPGATYVYCLVQSARAPSVRGAPAGIPGAGPPRVLPVGRGIWAIVADAPLDRFSGEQLQQDLQDIETVSRHALAHASMIEFFFERAPVIPLKLFTLFSQDDRARRHLAGRGSQVRTLFARLRGLEEWGIRITAAPEPLDVPPAALTGPITTSGRDYLRIKKRLQDRGGAPSRGTQQDVGAALKALAAQTRKEDFPPAGRGRPFVAGASFLVKAKRRTAWRKRVAEITRALDRQGHRLEMSGPWPPYHFASQSKAGK